MVKYLNIGKNIGKPIYRSISNGNTLQSMFIYKKKKCMLFQTFMFVHNMLANGNLYITTDLKC